MDAEPLSFLGNESSFRASQHVYVHESSSAVKIREKALTDNPLDTSEGKKAFEFLHRLLAYYKVGGTQFLGNFFLLVMVLIIFIGIVCRFELLN
jgi:hypothetical protein